MTVAQLGFAWTGTYGGALSARVFVGMGDAMVFISVLRLIASWFPPMRSPLVTAFTAMLGQCGALVAAIPLSRSLATYGWTVDVRGQRLGRHPARPARGRAGPRRTAGGAAVPVGQGRPHRRPGPAARLAGPGHPARALVALHHPVRRERDGAAVGVPVLRARRAPHRGRGRGAAHPAGRGVHRRRAADRRLHLPAPLAALDGRAVHRRGDGDRPGPSPLLWPGDAPTWLLVRAGRDHRSRRAGVDDRLRPRAHVRARVPARPGQRDRQRRRLHRLAARGAGHRPGARRGHAGVRPPTTARRPTRPRCACSTSSGCVGGIAGLAVPLPRPGAPRATPSPRRSGT